MKILQITDIHHGPYTIREDLERLVELGNREEPDLVVLTGDFVLNSSQYIQECIQILRNLSAREGTFAVLGNHDHREGGSQIAAALVEAGIEVLENRHVVLEREGTRIYLAGVADLEEDEPDLDKAFDRIPHDQFRILLSHNPDIAEYMDGHRADLIISGHTHGGQFVFPLIGPPVMPNKYRRYRQGLLQGPSSLIFVSRGVGATLLPLRISCPPEMNVLTLVPSSSFG